MRRFSWIGAAFLFAACGGPEEAVPEPAPVTEGHAVSICVRSEEKWRLAPETWPAEELVLGMREYQRDELLAILEQPIDDNGAVAIARPLIAAKLNVLAGADARTIGGAVRIGDLLLLGHVVPPIGQSHLQSELTAAPAQTLRSFNDGNSAEPCD